MSSANTKVTTTRPYDDAMVLIADYLCNPPIASEEAYHTAHACLADALGCGILALNFKACTKLLGPIVPETIVPNGSRVPGTKYILDPIRAAFNIGVMIRWLDYNDTWLAAEWGHPSDNLGGLLAVADYISQVNIKNGNPPLLVKDLLQAMIQAYEIQGGLALHNSFNRIGFDHVILVKVATAAVVAKLMGATHQQILDTLSNAWIDVGPLRTYRQAPNAGSRKSWAAGDATSRGVMLAWMVMNGEMGYPTALTAKHWGLYDILFHGKPFSFQRPLGSYVMENILFKVSYPAEFHAQTAIECACHLHDAVKKRLTEIASIDIMTHASALRIIDKKGPLRNPADRDHCIQYMVAVSLLKGTLTAEDYEDAASQDPRIDMLREKMTITEHKQYSLDYHDPEKRSIGNTITIKFHDGTTLEPISVEYPIGHRQRRKEGIPLLFQKFETNLRGRFSKEKSQEIMALFQDHQKLLKTNVPALVDLFSQPLC